MRQPSPHALGVGQGNAGNRLSLSLPQKPLSVLPLAPQRDGRCSAHHLTDSKETPGNANSGTANAAQAGPTQGPGGGRLPGNGTGRPGFGAPVTGAAADQAKAAALAKYAPIRAGP